ncbi:unnamed protein product [Symbiodinium microadriaticum]|nr:unnamed protein product [Symbiodinium microadriaticum]
MCELSGWLFRSKKSPWGTHATGNNLSEACLRYLQVAEPGDALMQLFARDILKENGIDESGDEHLNFTRTVEILDKMWASHRHALEMNGNWPERALQSLAAKILGSEGLKMPPDVKCSAGAEALELSFRRNQTEENVLYECFGMVLASAHELLEYTLYLRRAPACAAALIAPGDGNESDIQRVLSSMKNEWETVLFMESGARTHALLKSRCRFTDFQNFREIHTMLQQCQYKLTPKAALKKANRSEGASMQAMMSVAVSKNFNMDEIVKPMNSTSAFHHNHDQLNTLSAFMEMKRLSLDILDASTHLWAAQCLGSGELLKLNGEFFVTTGRLSRSNDIFTPQAIRLKELPWVFRGGLPDPMVDETRLPNDAQKAAVQVAKFMLYTLHLAPDSLASKIGCGLLLRRGVSEFTLLPYLVETKKILRLPSASLSDLLLSQNVRMPKNTTVACKIRRLLAEDAVKQSCSEKTVQEIIQFLESREEKRKNHKEKDEEKDESEEYHWQELNDDPATAACRQLLAGMDEETEGEGAEEDECMPEGAPLGDENEYQSAASDEEKRGPGVFHDSVLASES